MKKNIAIACIVLIAASCVVSLPFLGLSLWMKAIDMGMYMPGRDTVDYFNDGYIEILGNKDANYLSIDNRFALPDISAYEVLENTLYVCSEDKIYTIDIYSGEINAYTGDLSDIPKLTELNR